MTAHRTASEGTAMTIEPSTEALFSAAIAGGRDGAPTMSEVRPQSCAPGPGALAGPVQHPGSPPLPQQWENVESLRQLFRSSRRSFTWNDAS